MTPAKAAADGRLPTSGQGLRDIVRKRSVNRGAVARSFAGETHAPASAGPWDDAYARFLEILEVRGRSG